MAVLEKKTKMWKDYNDNENSVSDANDEDDKHNFQSEVHLSLWLRWTKNWDL